MVLFVWLIVCLNLNVCLCLFCVHAYDLVIGLFVYDVICCVWFVFCFFVDCLLKTCFFVCVLLFIVLVLLSFVIVRCVVCLLFCLCSRLCLFVLC